MKKLTVTALAATCVFGSAASADAAGKQRVLVDRFVEPYEFPVPCADFGPWEFDNLVSGVQRIRVVDVFASDGTLLKTEFHIALREIDTNSETGASLPVKGTVREVWHYATNTRTLSGSVWMANQPGEGIVVHDSGRITLTLDTREAQFMAGPKEAFLAPGGVDELVCGALADLPA